MKLRRSPQPFSGTTKGSALVFTSVLILSMVVMGYGLLRVTASANRRVSGERDDQRAFYLAEAAMCEAQGALRAGFSGAVGSFNQPAYLGGGVLWVTAEDLGSNQSRYVATAMAGSGRAALETVVEFDPDENPLFVATINSKDELTLNQGVLIDSYNSTLGPYASQVASSANGFPFANPNGHVRSNKDVLLSNLASVFGDAIPGPGHSTSFSAGSFGSAISRENFEEPLVSGRKT